MSNALAIAAVSAVLRDLLNNAMIDHAISTTVGSPVTVTALPPDRIKTGDTELPQLNIFLYHVASNTGWSNTELPSRDTQGNRITNSPLALDLYYLLSAYGKSDFDGEILLGYAMQMLHETPVLPRAAIRTALGGVPPVSSNLLPIGPLAASDLADQIEQIKISPQLMNIEEVWKLWTALQAPYRPTAAYRVSTVLIQSSKPAKTPLPVSSRNILLLQFRQPFIDSVTPLIVSPGASITISGRNLNALSPKLNFGLGALVDPSAITDNSIVATPPATLPAGVNSVQVVQQIALGTQGVAHNGFESNVAPFVLAPQITTPQPISVQRGNTLTLSINPPGGRVQRASLILAERSIPIQARPATGPDTTPTLDFPIPPDFPPGSYTVRIQIDGALSALEIDQNPGSSTFGQLTGNPKITVTP
jgi:Pvc16 N-terminal domain/IPT/TIG domain